MTLLSTVCEVFMKPAVQCVTPANSDDSLLNCLHVAVGMCTLVMKYILFKKTKSVSMCCISVSLQIYMQSTAIDYVAWNVKKWCMTKASIDGPQ